MPGKKILEGSGFCGHRLAEKISKYATDAESGHIRLADIVSENLNTKGVGFLGVLVQNCPLEYRDGLLYLLKSSLSECVLDNVRMWVSIRDLTDKFVDERFVDMLRVYRECHPYNLLLIYDPRRSVNTGNGFYTIDFDCLMRYEKD